MEARAFSFASSRLFVVIVIPTVDAMGASGTTSRLWRPWLAAGVLFLSCRDYSQRPPGHEPVVEIGGAGGAAADVNSPGVGGGAGSSGTSGDGGMPGDAG